MMDLTLMDRLKVLNFDEEFRKDMKMRPMSRYYFLVESNPLEQFHIFTSLAVWLCRKCGLSDIQQPLEDDDPNSTLTGILDAARSLGIAVDFSPNKLKQGFGEHVTYLLERLSDRALRASNYEWQSINPKMLEDANGTADQSEGEEAEEEDEEEEDLEDDNGLPEEMDYSSGSDGENTIDKRYEEKIDNQSSMMGWDAGSEWWNEVERAVPALRIRIAPSARDWRQHTQQLLQHRTELSKQSSCVGESLSRCVARATMHMEACASRQSLLQERASGKLDKLATLVKQTALASENYKSISGGVTQRQEILAELTEKVEAVRQKTEMKGSAMNDQSPVVNIKRYVNQLKKELQEMDVQLAVLMWCVEEHHTRAKRAPI